MPEATLDHQPTPDTLTRALTALGVSTHAHTVPTGTVFEPCGWCHIDGQLATVSVYSPDELDECCPDCAVRAATFAAQECGDVERVRVEILTVDPGRFLDSHGRVGEVGSHESLITTAEWLTVEVNGRAALVFDTATSTGRAALGVLRDGIERALAAGGAP